ncbi:tyrosine-type recombinase/integrase [Herbivorax sp. ANBcel31]|uniref:site-specific integrase n=1 Tax=Herbivorax sp. ANBcel31 TaxID=3069754 RepID=UPI0027B6CDEF|nr:tyrosine-type recombinase/integrase [Herbivorax sp. ANBcel31]MDQ2086478.1 tyrosine-type recombinase/integrase [Herbivorax sp. ANBcel31]
MASIRKRGNSYQIIVSAGYDSGGKKLTKQKSVKRPDKITDKQWEKELNKIAAEFELAVEKGEYYDPSKFTLSDFIDKWLVEHGKNLENKTLYRYKGMLKGRVNKALGHLKLDQIKPLHLLEFYRNLQEPSIREDGKKGSLSNKTIGHYHGVLSAMLNSAFQWGMIKENPCVRVKPPKAEQQEMKYLEEDELIKFYDCLSQEPIKIQAMILVSLMTGCRRGELAALQWKHIDLDNGVIHIKQAAEYTPETGIIIKKPKTRSSIRQIAIPDSLVQVLKFYRSWWLEQKLTLGTLWQEKERLKQGGNWVDPEWLFASMEGYIMHLDTFTKTFKKFLKRHDLNDIRLHDLRHTSATMLLHSGLNVRAVASRLGHANPNVTLSVYAHALQSADKEAANIMEGLIKKKDDSEEKNKA